MIPGYYWVQRKRPAHLPQPSPEVMFFGDGAWWPCGDERPVALEQVTVVSDLLQHPQELQAHRIAVWIDKTFPGADPRSPRRALRLLEEAIDLAVACGADETDIANTTARAPKHPALDRTQIPQEAADVCILLYSLAKMYGFSLQEAVERKHAINVDRKWAALGDGTGYHIKDNA